MPGFEVVRRTPLDAPEAWRRITAWERHQEFAPLTTVRVSRDEETGREMFVARTGIGPLGFDDSMLVTYAIPPTETSSGIARIVKTGRAVRGWAVLTVSPRLDGAEVRWHEEAAFRGTPRPLARLVNIPLKRGFGRLVDGLLAS